MWLDSFELHFIDGIELIGYTGSDISILNKYFCGYNTYIIGHYIPSVVGQAGPTV